MYPARKQLSISSVVLAIPRPWPSSDIAHPSRWEVRQRTLTFGQRRRFPLVEEVVPNH
jgi:hypothetical protein